jgi:hypothetical protein
MCDAWSINFFPFGVILWIHHVPNPEEALRRCEHLEILVKHYRTTLSESYCW